MKKTTIYSLLGVIVTIVVLILVSYLTVLSENAQYLHNMTAQSFSPPILPFYIKFPIIFFVILLVLFLYRSRQNLKKEIRLREQSENDILEQGKRLEKSLALSKATLEATADGILVVDENRKIAGHNNKFSQMWGIPSSILVPGNDDEAVGFVLSQLKDPESFIKSLERLYNSEPGAEHLDELEFKDGRVFERYTKPQIQGDKIIGRVFSFRDVTKKKEMEEQLIYQATHDVLTNMPNRVILLDRMSQSISKCKRTDKIGAILFFDLDRFKLVNDSLGHDIGDILLQEAARRLEHCVREQDTVARWGGDEFVILISDLSEEKYVIPIVLKCLKALEENFIIEKYTLSITSSAGISFFPKDGVTPVTLLKKADSAMYHAKAKGPNNYIVYNKKMSVTNQKQLELTNELHDAVNNNELTVFYQPLINLETCTIVGAEALLRWNHPKLGFISPEKFIPIAEETGLIITIGEWVLRKACLQNKIWQENELPFITMAINLSGQQFKQKNIPQIVAKILEETKLDPQYLDLELTESVIMDNTQAFLRYMIELKKMGVNLSIDDFGTGYSSLSYLKRFPVNTLKIDRSFVSGLTEKNDDAAIVRAILAMAKQLNLKVIAEGIETEEQLSLLQQYSCNMGQGFLFSKAIPPEEFSTLLKINNFMAFSKTHKKKA